MTRSERDLLGKVAAARGMTIAAVLREGLALVAERDLPEEASKAA